MKSPVFTLVIGSALMVAASALQADHNTAKALKNRVAAVGTLNIVTGIVTEEEATANEGPVAVAASAEPADGAAVYNGGCNVCHTAGLAGAPKPGDTVAWQPRIAQGLEMLVEHAIKGYQGEAGIMPAKGGNPALSDEEVAAAVEYMIEGM